jgi:hypothetical protein
MLSTWLTWGLLALIPVAAVILRFLAGEDPDNEESGEDQGESQEPDGLLAAA